jgi:hypothetical protein
MKVRIDWRLGAGGHCESYCMTPPSGYRSIEQLSADSQFSIMRATNIKALLPKGTTSDSDLSVVPFLRFGPGIRGGGAR